MRLRARFSMSECVTPESVVSSRESRRLANLLDVRRIYLEPAVHARPRGREILARFPEAELIEAASHWRIPELFGMFGNEGAARDWVRNKRTVLVLGVKKAMTIRPSARRHANPLQHAAAPVHQAARCPQQSDDRAYPRD
jgi:hypothetical protein